MSKEKVERYKQEKANRKKIMAKQKAQRMAAMICGWVFVAVIVGWAGYTGYQYYEKNKPMDTIYCETTEIDNYLNSLSK